ncbi:XRE family transcriptional regulator [Nonomuraea sp. FMUSA5-5]|uniref:XRE family transcriptional regulator n=1 Tax=Nonomuraea composti TaxID=2720023 RepID=A0ABX1B2H4_9ACTN|nr:XRE family transcriptional regulator [Nonomuraea sp. FMUSA5-5]NJP89403.1 XRE family transcriptional regulator [Nonomuraea sp. FMUSA5-5]
MTDQGPQRPPATLAEKLEYLFQHFHPRDRGPYSNDEVAAGIRKQGGPTISGTYIWYLRKGERDNPTIKHIEALAKFFEVPPRYFLEDDPAITEQLMLLNAMRDADVKAMAMRAVGLSAESLASIREVVDRMRELEDLRQGDAGQDTASGP